MIRYEYAARDTKAETLSDFDSPGRPGIRAKANPYFIMLNWVLLGEVLGDAKLKKGTQKYKNLLGQWGAVRLFHEGYHVLDERVFGFGRSIPEETAATKAEILFYKFIHEKYGYTDPDLEVYAKMTDEQLRASLEDPKKYGGIPKTRRGYDPNRIFPLIPPLLP
jgi:hypothetical protein